MQSEIENIFNSKQSTAKIILEAYKVFREEGNHLTCSEVMRKINQRVELNDWEQERLRKTINNMIKANHISNVTTFKTEAVYTDI